MALTKKDCEKMLANMPASEQSVFLAQLGHFLTVVAREAYEFQGSGVTNPRLLRDLNEIHHRIYSQIRSLTLGSEQSFPPEALASWLSAEGKSKELQDVCLNAFESCMPNANHSI
ncbi:hypothetical protein [Undibacterium flavidum]|uniref:Uncharacterized protein n=1 Tax=Undibacterium flavidum TaxID=2762297 RepID=A0ABR6YAD2_9BURK|nr:hypothetical protein [Undibacterium flavidum]MBC3873589.1 hypothetical protein [Undibacterium flavidum]